MPHLLRLSRPPANLASSHIKFPVRRVIAHPTRCAAGRTERIRVLMHAAVPAPAGLRGASAVAAVTGDEGGAAAGHVGKAGLGTELPRRLAVAANVTAGVPR